MFYCKVLDWC